MGGRGGFVVCEIFSPERACKAARKRGMRAGWPIDVSAKDPITGRAYNLLEEQDREEVRAMLKRDRPRLLILSPHVLNTRVCRI